MAGNCHRNCSFPTQSHRDQKYILAPVCIFHNLIQKRKKKNFKLLIIKIEKKHIF